MSQQHHAPDLRNLILAVVISTAVLLGWQKFVAEPQRQAALDTQVPQETAESPTVEEAQKPELDEAPIEPKAAVIEEIRVPIKTDVVEGSVNARGLRLDDLILSEYSQTTQKDSEPVVLLSPTSQEKAYFAEFGWLSSDKKAGSMPNKNTIWQVEPVAGNNGVQAKWSNEQGVTFEQNIISDEPYLFNVEQTVTNHTNSAITLYPYSLINRRFDDAGKHFFILHEGPLGVFDETLTEVTYKELREEKKQSFSDSRGWIGITDKYWLTALLPDQGQRLKANMTYTDVENSGKYQVDYLGEAITLQPGEATTINNHFFAGAKKVDLLDAYGEELGLPLFDRAVDFGMLYFLTKPIFQGLQMLYAALGNFGLAIMALTVLIKLLLFPLANKSYKSMSQMKVLMPKITEIRERYGDDKMKMNQEIMELYKREKVNPASGCLPLLLQLPVFFALYKVLFVTIEMRHAPFFGWINDLSAPDPTSVFNMFGLIPWDPPQMLMIGAWPLIMCGTMIIQQRLNPKPTDETQAMVMAWLPFIFLFLFASFPAGLVIYWAWNNTLSILQQWVISRRHGPKS